MLNASGLKVSKPTYNVNTATGRQLAFVSNGPKYLGVYLDGEIPLASFAVVGAPSISTYTVQQTRRYTLNYGKTFAAAPILLTAFVASLDSTRATTHFSEGEVVQISSPGGGTSGYGGSAFVMARSFVDKAVFEIYYTSYGGAPYPAGPSKVAYVVGQSG